MIPAWAAGSPCLPDPTEGESSETLLRPPAQLHMAHPFSRKPQLTPSHLYMFKEAQN